MAVVKSKILENLSNNYPNFLKKDLLKLINIILDQIEKSLTNGERIELKHIASSRKVFSVGALKAASWLHQKKAGLYTISDMLKK